MGFDWHQLWEISSAPDNIPIVALLFLIPFFCWMAFRQAFANDRLIAQLEADPQLAKTAHRKNYPWKAGWSKELQTWPYLMRVEFLAAIIVTVILFVWSITLNAPLEELANPNLTMNPAKAPWYFLGLPTLIVFGLMIIPYVDTNPLGSGYYTWKQRRFSIATFCFGFLFLWVLMVIVGTFIRGPGWMWFWPGQTWDPSRVIYEVNRDLPDIFGIGSMAGKAIFGAVVMALYFAGAGYLFHRAITWNDFNRKIYQRMSLIQYITLQIFLITMLLLPVKMILRLVFRIKYVWVTWWFNV